MNASMFLNLGKEKVRTKLNKWIKKDEIYYTLSIGQGINETTLYLTESQRQELLKTLAGDKMTVSEWDDSL